MKMLENKRPWKVLKLLSDKFVYHCLNEYMKICEYNYSRLFFDLQPRKHILTVSNISTKASRPVVTKFQVDPAGAEGMNSFLKLSRSYGQHGCHVHIW